MAEPCRECGGHGEIALRVVVAAIAIDDMDAAIDGGLLAWNGCVACALQQGLAPAEIEALHAARGSRLHALAARDRFRAREQRLQRRREQHALQQPRSPHGIPSPLPASAATALARAKAKAGQRDGT
jgi:hypothetical protein